MKHECCRRERGLTLIETGLALCVLIVLVGALVMYSASAARQQRLRNEAQRFGMVWQAADAYVAAARTDILRQANASCADTADGALCRDPMVSREVTMEMLKQGNFLPTPKLPQVGADQDLHLRLRVRKASLLKEGWQIQALLFSYGGTPYPDDQIGQMVTLIGTAGGMIKQATPGVIDGAGGAWRLSIGPDWSGTPAPTPGHLVGLIADGMQYDGAGRSGTSGGGAGGGGKGPSARTPASGPAAYPFTQLPGTGFRPAVAADKEGGELPWWLSRYDVGYKELNTMHTDIRMDKNSLRNAWSINARYLMSQDNGQKSWIEFFLDDSGLEAKGHDATLRLQDDQANLYTSADQTLENAQQLLTLQQDQGITLSNRLSRQALSMQADGQISLGAQDGGPLLRITPTQTSLGLAGSSIPMAGASTGQGPELAMSQDGSQVGMAGGSPALRLSAASNDPQAAQLQMQGNQARLTLGAQGPRLLMSPNEIQLAFSDNGARLSIQRDSMLLSTPDSAELRLDRNGVVASYQGQRRDLTSDTASAGNGASLSDRRLKTGLTPLTGALADIARLQGYRFQWKNSGQPDIGVVAQEVEQVYPELVHTDPKTGLKSVVYQNLVAPLIEAVKELHQLLLKLQQALHDLSTRQQQQQREIDALTRQLQQQTRDILQIKQALHQPLTTEERALCASQCAQ